MCIPCVLCVFTGTSAHANTVCNSEVLPTINMQAHACVKFKLSGTI